MTTPHIRILVVDDHPVVRDGLTALLTTQPDFTVIGEAATGAEALQQTAVLTPDVVIMDLQMPGINGAAATAAIRTAHPDVRVLVLTTYDTNADITAAIDAGAAGYLLKDTGREELCAAVRAAARGEAALSPSVAAKVLAHMRGDRGASLSGREVEVLSAVSRGQSNKQIGRALRLSEATVKTHLLHIYAKLGVADRTAAVTAALERGIIRIG
ncbi:two component transcriptional regulator, LuxR family [Streptomyces lincolnensis]|uniref:Two component transcriptional regulator, LuxR family n=1 Tax=Streptomyces lincolnensis TaxID=1915 RepID=A0A1B1M2I2_STRLN|nr:response regulator transcription factor [Streptomyces lincolnensis]ANS62856.1 two component transcriptional regulator, LuxR family [Streptomyces lincolnensis]AXG51780.1 two component transcriptional regulator, LuxR family [Streptomyces lincolnensis]QMV04792.1 response regulator [Streptomyces lincolnensis]